MIRILLYSTLLIDFGLTIGLYLAKHNLAEFLESEILEYSFEKSLFDVFVISIMRPFFVLLSLREPRKSRWYLSIVMLFSILFTIMKCIFFYSDGEDENNKNWNSSHLDVLFLSSQMTVSFIEVFGSRWGSFEKERKPKRRLFGRERTVVITGGSSSLGASLARIFARKGYRVVLLARTKSAIDSIAAEITAVGGLARAYAVDLSDSSAVSTISNRILVEFGIPDVLINGATAKVVKTVEDTSPLEVVSTMSVPYFSAFYVTHSFLPCMIERGYGCIINISNLASYIPCPDAAAYSCAQYAMHNFHTILSLHTQDTDILVTEVLIGKLRHVKKNGMDEYLPHLFKNLPSVSPEEAARKIFDGLVQGEERIILPYWRLSGILFLNRIFPSLVSSFYNVPRPTIHEGYDSSLPSPVIHDPRTSTQRIRGSAAYFAPSIN